MIIGISGFIGSGKDTLANILISDYNYVKLSFSSILKDIISILFSWDRNLLEGDTTESREFREKIDEYWSNALKTPITPRYVMQNIGTELFRNHFNEDIWIHALYKKIINLDNKNIVITDIRFPNEHEMVKKLNGITIKINRKICKVGTHKSETEWLSCAYDYEINNDSDITYLKKNIKYILNKNNEF